MPHTKTPGGQAVSDKQAKKDAAGTPAPARRSDAPATQLTTRSEGPGRRQRAGPHRGPRAGRGAGGVGLVRLERRGRGGHEPAGGEGRRGSEGGREGGRAHERGEYEIDGESNCLLIPSVGSAGYNAVRCKTPPMHLTCVQSVVSSCYSPSPCSVPDRSRSCCGPDCCSASWSLGPRRWERCSAAAVGS